MPITCDQDLARELDRWLTTDPVNQPGAILDEYDPPCPACGYACSDHPQIVVPATDDEWAYELTVCPSDPRVADDLAA